MKNLIDCNDRKEAIVALVLGELDSPAAQELREHIECCQVCRGVRDALADEEKNVRSAFESLARGLKPSRQAIPDGGNRQVPSRASARWPVHLLKGVRTMIFSRKWASVAAVAAVAVVAMVLLCWPALPPVTSYALGQTTQANSEVKYYHVKLTPAGQGVSEAWAELDDNGEVVHTRTNFPKSEDGAKVVILSGDKAEVWFKDKNSFVTFKDHSMVKMFAQQRIIFDPKLMFEQLLAAREAGKVQVETQEPAKKGEPITVTSIRSDNPDRKEVYLINVDTKLVEQVSKYERKDGTWKVLATIEYLDYNKRIDPSIWEPELPKDVMKVDQTAGKIGVAKGDLKDDEIVAKVAKEFFEALIVEDYEKAGQIYSGLPAERIKNVFGGMKVLRIVEVGQPKPHPDKRTQFLLVPVRVEVESGGEKTVKEFVPKIRPVYNQPDRWAIDGGI